MSKFHWKIPIPLISETLLIKSCMQKKNLTHVNKSLQIHHHLWYNKLQHFPKLERPHKERISKQCYLQIYLSGMKSFLQGRRGRVGAERAMAPPPVIETRRKIGNLLFHRNLCLGLPACNNGNFTSRHCLQYMNEKNTNDMYKSGSVDVRLCK